MRRLVATLGVGAAALALAGCEVSGTVDVGTDATVIDLTFVTRSGPNCVAAPTDLVLERVGTTADGAPICRLTGTLRDDSVDARARHFLDRYTVTERGTLFVTVPASVFSAGGVESLTAIDLTVRTPGAVRIAGEGARVTGTGVVVFDARAVRAQGLTLVAGRRPGVPPALAWAAGGLVVGLTLALAGLALRSRAHGRPRGTP